VPRLATHHIIIYLPHIFLTTLHLDSLYDFTKCKTPVNSITAILSTGMKDLHFTRTGTCQYEIYVPGAPRKPRRSLKIAEKTKASGSLKDGISIVLSRSECPMCSDDIYKEILKRSLYNFAKCKTPRSSISAALSTGIKQKLYVRKNNKYMLTEEHNTITRESRQSKGLGSQDKQRKIGSKPPSPPPPPTQVNQMVQQHQMGSFPPGMYPQYFPNPVTMNPLEYYFWQRQNCLAYW